MAKFAYEFLTPIRGILEKNYSPEFLDRQKLVETLGKSFKILFYLYLADELFYFLAVVAEVKQGFTGDGFSKVKVN